VNLSNSRLSEFSFLAFILTVLGFLASNCEYSAHGLTQNKKQNQSATIVRESDDLGFGDSELVKSVTDSNSAPALLSAKTTRQSVTLQFHDVIITACRKDVSYPLTDVAASGSGTNFDFCVANLIRLASSRNLQATKWMIERFTTDWQGAANPDLQFQFDGTRYNLQKIDGIRIFHCANVKADDRAIIRAQPI
jgi:hypothetical protein